MTKAVASGMPKLRIEESAARRQARVDRGDEVIVGVNKYQPPTPSTSTCWPSTTPTCAASRSPASSGCGPPRRAACQDALRRLTEGAAGKENLLALCIEAARARATVGEMSRRHGAGVRPAQGRDPLDPRRVRRRLRGRRGLRGRPARRRGLRRGRGPPAPHAGREDGPGRPRPGAKVIATAFADLGFDVDVGPLFQTPAEAARDAVDNDVHVVGVSSQAAGHLTLVPQLIDELRAAGAEDVVVVCGGVIPPQDYDALHAAGVAAIFGPGTNIWPRPARCWTCCAPGRPPDP